MNRNQLELDFLMAFDLSVQKQRSASSIQSYSVFQGFSKAK